MLINSFAFAEHGKETRIQNWHKLSREKDTFVGTFGPIMFDTNQIETRQLETNQIKSNRWALTGGAHGEHKKHKLPGQLIRDFGRVSSG